MSGKYLKKKKKKKKSLKGLWIALVVAVCLFAGVLVLVLSENAPETPETNEPVMTAPQINVPETTETVTVTETVAAREAIESFTLDENLEITKVGSYTGAYMEDGSDELVSGVMMIVVANNGEEALQYAEITLSGDAGDALFKLSTLKPGETAVVLEANRKEYSVGDAYETASIANVVYFTEPLSLYEDTLKIQPLDGGFNITNISDQDITGKITIYFKDSADGMYYGGITYRGSISGGMKAGEIKQVMSENFSASGSTVVFITITEE